MNISTNFTYEEAVESATAIKKGINNIPTPAEVINIKIASAGMELVRTILGNNSIKVSSWFRCKALNKTIGGASTSAHTLGYAIDFTCPKFGTPKQICEALLASGIKVDQVIYEQTWVHISFAPTYRNEYLTATFSNGKATYSKGIK